jgi:serine/threonine protein kinase
VADAAGAADADAAPTPEQALTARVGRVLTPTYDLDREIGRGGMGIVYRAVDRRLKRAVAVKVLPPDLAFRPDIRSRFLQEAETAAQLSHPNIVPIYTVDERDGLVFFVMAFIDGQTLGQRLKATPGPMPVPAALSILREVGSALAYAHAHGVIHRDIKPDNILLASDGLRALVTDFGIARAVTSSGDSRLTATGVAIGTPAYMSPEQCSGDKEVDGRSDLYSLGVVAYQMLCGSLPFSGGNTAMLLVKQLSETPVPLRQRCPSVPEGVAAAVMRLLAKDPSGRFPDANAFLAALDAGAAAPAGSAAPFAAAPFGAAPPQSAGGPSRPAWSTASPRPIAPPMTPPITPPWQTSPDPRFAARPVSPLPPPGTMLPPLAPPVDVRELVGAYVHDRLNARLDRSLARVDSQISSRSQRKELRRKREELRDRLRHERRDGFLDSDPRIVKIRKFRSMVVSYGGTMVFLAGINLLTSPSFPWCLFPILGMGLSLHKAAGRLWAEGVSMSDVFGKRAREALAHGVMPPTSSLYAGGAAPAPEFPAGYPVGAATQDTADALANASASRLAPPAILAGPYGAAVRRAALDRDRIHDLVDHLDAARREMAPNARTAADGLADQVGGLAMALHRIDVETPAAQQPALAERRDEMVAQLDRAGLTLQTLYLDLLRLRMSDAGASADTLSTATEQASALSRDIGYVLGAADELRSIDGTARGK